MSSHVRLLCIALLTSISLSPAAGQSSRSEGTPRARVVDPAASSPPRSRYTPAETRAVGAQVMAAHVARYGRATNPAWERDVDTIIGLLRGVVALPELDVTWVIVDNDQVNASAAPGGFMIINAGLLEAVTTLAQRDAPSDSTRRRRRFMAYTAAVLGHELAHMTLNHTDELMDRLRRKGFRLALGDTASTRSQAILNAAMSDSGFMAAKARSRDTEAAADAFGALYLLRAGWEIQDAMDLFRWFDTWERESGNTSPEDLTWVRSHPRSSVREASLEAMRARLKLHQATFDDALTLVRNDVMIDSAIVMLDRVLADFPNEIAARHARAAAWHRKWLASTSVERLKVRSAVPTYGTNFLGKIRGDRSDSTALRNARRGYADVLSRRVLPYTLSNLAVLDAYAGATTLARLRADSAALMSPDNGDVLINRGVVLYLTGRVHEAKQVFAQAAQHTAADDEDAHHAIRYNLGATLQALGETKAARDTLARYIAADRVSPWSRQASVLLDRSARPSADTGLGAGQEGATRVAAPTAGGVSLGDSKTDVIARLGEPDGGPTARTRSIWRYSARGVTVVTTDPHGVVLIRLTTAASGAVDGVSVGDPVSAARAHWGQATRDDAVLRFHREDWLVTVLEEKGVIRAIAVSGT